ncbi:MAG: DUF5372 family protein, partial [Pseudomonadales bacterium]
LPSDQPHDAHYSHQYVLVKYPFHPLHGQRLEVVGERTYHNQTHLVVKTPSQGQIHLPQWMTQEQAGDMSITTSPALSWWCLSNLSAYLKQINVLFSEKHHMPMRRRKNGQKVCTSIQSNTASGKPKSINPRNKPARSPAKVR